MPTFTDPERPRRDLGRVIHDVGGIRRFNRLLNRRVDAEPEGPNKAPRGRRRPRPSAPHRRRHPALRRPHDVDPEYGD